MNRNTLLEQTFAESVGYIRILWISADGEQCYAISVPINGSATPIALPRLFDVSDFDDCRKLDYDPYLQLQAKFDRLDEGDRSKYLSKAEARYAIISSIVEQPELRQFSRKIRGPLVLAAMAKHGVSKMAVYRNLRLYWQRGSTLYALLPDWSQSGSEPVLENPHAAKRGRWSAAENALGYRVNMPITRAIRRKLEQGFRKFSHLSLRASYDQTILEYFNAGRDHVGGVIPQTSLEVPSEKQYRRVVEQYRRQNAVEVDIKQRGERRHKLSGRAIIARTHAWGPGSIYQIDSTVADLNLVSRINRSWIVGRPILYAVIDLYSSLIVGILVTLNYPSYLAAAAALYNANENKVAYAKRLGISLEPDDWLGCGLPRELVADRGELISKKSDYLTRLGIRLCNTPPYRADLKAMVERSFRTFNDLGVRWLDGAVRGPKERGESDPRLEATLDIYEFTQILVREIVYHQACYKPGFRMEADVIAAGIERTPGELWRWGIENRCGIITECNPDLVRMALLPRIQGSVTERGIMVKGLLFANERSIQSDWHARARLQGRSKIDISYDPRSANSIWAMLDDKYEEFVITDANGSYALNRSWEELDHYKTHELEQKHARKDAQLRAKALTDSNVEKIVAQARARTAQAIDEAGPPSKSARLKNIRENRAQEPEPLSSGYPVARQAPKNIVAFPAPTPPGSSALDELESLIDQCDQ